MTTVTELLSHFDGCTTIPETNVVYKKLHAEHGNDGHMWVELNEAHRLAMMHLMERGNGSRPRVTVAPVDRDRIRPNVLRTWARLRGIPLPTKGRVPAAIENEYRSEHDLPLIPDKTKRPSVKCGVHPAVIREWARSEGLKVGDRGRLHPDVVAQYLAAQSE